MQLKYSYSWKRINLDIEKRKIQNIDFWNIMPTIWSFPFLNENIYFYTFYIELYQFKR